MKKNVPTTDPNGEAKRQLLEKAESLMTVRNKLLELLIDRHIDYLFRM